MRRWLAGLLGVTVLVVASAGAAIAAPDGSGGGGDGGANLVGDQGDTETLSYRDTINLSIDDIQAYWVVTLPEVFGVEYEEISEVIPYDSDTDPDELPACATGASYEDIRDNAFYCFEDDTVSYDDESLLPTFYENYGNFAIAFALAHEWGHAIQGRVAPEVFSGVIPSVYYELQADCYAGAWTGWVDGGNSEQLLLEEGDLEAGIAGMLQVRDPVGTDVTDESSGSPHGSGFDRVSAFQEGFEQGAARCAAYFETPPAVTELPFTEEEDLANEGNLPFAEAVPAFTEDLELYWTAVFEAVGATYDGIADVESYNPKKKATLPECEALDLAPNQPRDYRGGVFYCPGDDFIAYDTTFLKQVHREIGDFASALLIGDAWARGMQEDLGIEGDPVDVAVQSDCFGGFWTGTIPVQIDVDENGLYDDISAQGDAIVRESAIVLSPGDLDEVVIGFTVFADPTAVEEGGTAFQRLQGFRTGFFADNLDECLALVG